MNKQLFLILSLLGMVMTASAQFKVHSNGKVVVANTTGTPSALFSVGDLPSLSGVTGVSSSTPSTGSGGYNTGIFGLAATSFLAPGGLQNYVNVGVHGQAANNSAQNIGVLGTIDASGIGAAICGRAESNSGSVSGTYAGYFFGDVRTTGAYSGNLSNRFDYTSLLYTSNMPSVLYKLCSIVPKVKTNMGPGLLLADGDEEGRQITPEYDIREHNSLDVSSVSSVFSDLVYTNGQNQSYVNYVEVIPILVKAIQELKAKVDSLSGRDADGGMYSAPRQHPMTSAIGSPHAVRGTLYQNAPNPFSSQTEIRFSLAEDTRNAYICIFDMTGKTLRQIPVDSSMQSVNVQAYEFPAGIYLYSLMVNGQEIDTKRMILSK